MDFTNIQARLEELISSEEFIDVARKGIFTNEKLEIINCKKYFVTLHDCKKLRPIYINDNQKNYLGFQNNLFRGIDYSYYFTTVHPSKIVSLVDSLIHISSGKPDFLNSDYRLKNSLGKYEYFIGSTKVFFINDKSTYALSVLKKTQDKALKKSKKLSGFSKITSREREIITLFISGMQTKEIAAHLFLSEHTIKSHIKSIYKKFGVNNIRELFAITDFLKLDDPTET